MNTILLETDNTNLNETQDDFYIWNETNNLPSKVILIKNICIPIFILIFIFGLFGNALTVIILKSKRLQQTSTAIYLTILAIVDILYLLASLLITIINYTFLFPNDLRHYSSIICILSPYLNYTLAYLSVWLLVFVTIDRAIWVVNPYNAKYICTKQNAWLTILFLIIFLFLIDTHFFWTMNYEQLNLNSSHIYQYNNENIHINHSISPNVTKFQCKSSYFTENIFPYIDLLLVCIIPCIFMLIANSLIGCQLKRMRDFNRRRHRLVMNKTPNSLINTNRSNCNNLNLHNKLIPMTLMKTTTMLTMTTTTLTTSAPIITTTTATTTATINNITPIEKNKKRYINIKYNLHNSSKKTTNLKRSSSLTAMLLAINIFFIISMCPLLVYDVIYFAFNLNNWIDIDQSNRASFIFGIERFVYTLWYANFSVHFLLYCLSGPQFRIQVKYQIKIWLNKLQNSNKINTNKNLSNNFYHNSYSLESHPHHHQCHNQN